MRRFRRRAPVSKRRTTFRRKNAKKRFHRFANKILRTAHEKKYIFGFSAVDVPSTTANNDLWVQPLTAIAEGDDENTRDGTQVYLRSIEIHVRARFNNKFTDAPTLSNNPWGNFISPYDEKVRLIVWQWLPPSDTNVAAGGALPGSVLINETTMSPYNHDFRRNFRILYDKSIHLANSVGPVGDATAPYNTNASLADFRVRIRKFAKREITWNGSGATTEANCHCYMSLITDYSEDSATPAQKPVFLVYDFKTNFSDK